MIVITGAAGFIASVVAGSLNMKGMEDLVLVDDFSKEQKKRNFANKKYRELVDRNVFFEWFDKNHADVDFVVHLGARTDTTEFDWNVFVKLNVNYTETMWSACAKYGIPLVYASSAATYGAGENGYIDSHDIVNRLAPLNPYGRSKNESTSGSSNSVRRLRSGQDSSSSMSMVPTNITRGEWHRLYFIRSIRLTRRDM